MKKSIFRPLFPYFFCVSIGVLIGMAIAFVNPGNNSLIGFFSGTLIGSLGVGLIWWIHRHVNGTRLLASATTLTFLLRFTLGLALFLALPVWGYDEEPPQHGYLYMDAYRRDSDAWRLTQSENSLISAFGEEFYTDQYGGLLSLSAAVYRLFSPDTHRPALILIFTALVSSLGVPFLWSAVRKRWNEKLANLAIWIYALYPESIILGSSQMREPFIIGLSAVTFWAVVEWQESRNKSIIGILLSLTGISLFSSRAAAAIGAIVIVWFWLDNLLPVLGSKWQKIGWIILGSAGGIAILFSLNWLINSARWDLYLVETSSGRIQFELDMIGQQWRVPFIVGYGLLQPVLSAAIAYPGIPIMRALAIFRAIGWYFLAPLLIFAFLSLWKLKPLQDKRIFIWFTLMIAAWVFISSIRAGGDQWDNVRYRAILTTWMVFLGGWGILRASTTKSPWLPRLFLIEIVFVLIFLYWYIVRYYGIFVRFYFRQVVLLDVVISVLIISSGILYDRYNKTNFHQLKPRK